MDEDLLISAGLLVELPVAEVTLFFRPAHSQSYYERRMQYQTGEWSATIVPGELSAGGIEYLIVMRTTDGRFYATPTDTPFETPHFVTVKPAGPAGRRFPGSDKVAAAGTVSADILILSPQVGELLAPEDVVIALSLFNADNIDTSSIRIEVDGVDYTDQALITADIISLHPPEMASGLHTVRVYLATIYGISVTPVVWSFGTSSDYVDPEERLAYSGEIGARIASDRIESQVLNISEMTAKAEAGVSWIKSRSSLRLTSRESSYLQPLNRYSTEVEFGNYLKIQAGDFYPLLTPFIMDGKRVRGVGVDLELKWFHFQAVSGTSERQVQHRNRLDNGYYLAGVDQDSTGASIYTLDRNGYTFKRQVNAYRLALDIKSKYNIGLAVLKSKDVISSVDKFIAGGVFSIDSTNTGGISTVPYQNYTYDEFASAISGSGAKLNFADLNWGGDSPEENLVAGLELGGAFDDDRLRVEANWYISLRNRNIWEGTMTRAQMDTALDDSLDGLIGVQYDEFGLIVGKPLMIDTLKIFDPVKYENIFTININMVPLLPFDYFAYEDAPLRAILNMPSTAYNLKIRGNYFKNNFSAEYRQVGPEYVSFGNPYLTSNIREFILADRVLLLDNKLLINGSYKYQSNRILSTTVDPYRTNTMQANITLAPGPDVPSITVNFQSMAKSNVMAGSDTVGTSESDVRESTLTRNSLMSINFPFRLSGMTSNLVVNRYQIDNFDLLADERRYDFVFNSTDSRSMALTLTSKFTNIPLRTIINLSQTTLNAAGFDYNWIIIGFRGMYSVNEDKTRINAGLNYLRSSGFTIANVYNTTTGMEYYLLKNLLLAGTFQFQIAHTPSWKNDKADNDGNGKTDEFLEAVKLNSSSINLTVNYRF
ncbi:MAG: hypothetical protein ABIA75_11025 [Candidatus Neomarinimicrobiota bacterium]